MAIYIEIKKIKSSNDIHYYRVQTKNFNQMAPFAIGIDSKKKKIYIYKDDTNAIPDFSIDLEDPHIENIFCTVPQKLLICVFVKALKAFTDQKYPEYISYEA